MSLQDTTSDDDNDNRWASHRILAFAIRTGVRLAPVAVAIGVSLLALHLLPKSFTGKLWPGRITLIALSVVASVLAERVARRAMPLAVLLQLTLLFPDRAPSRLKVARGGGRPALDVAAQQDRSATAERVLGLLTSLTSHDKRTRGHCERVRVYADMLGTELKLPRADQDRLRWAALLHDIGKLEVDAALLNKPGKPSDREWLILRAHPEQGARLAAPLLEWLGEWGYAIEQHHERFDGTGYPTGLAGEDITRAGRLLAIVDAYEVMTAARAYKRAMSARAARAELARCASTHFDPVLVRAFLSISLPRLLWTTGPLSFAGQLPFLRQLGWAAQQAPAGGAVATTTAGSLLAASLAAAAGAPVPAPTAFAARQITTAAASGGSTYPTSPVHQPSPPAHVSTVDPPGTAQPFLPAPAPATPTSPTTTTPTPITPSPPDPTAPVSAPPTPTPPAAPPTPPSPTAPPPTATAPAPPVTTPPPTPPVPTPPPAVSVTSEPAALVRTNVAHFEFSAPGADSLEYALDGGSWQATAHSLDLAGVADGAHTLEVRSVLAGSPGNASTVTWTVDTVAPVLAFTATPNPITNDAAAHLAWTIDDPAATLTCQLDAGAATPCAGTSYDTTVANGSHTLTIVATDLAGNSSTWTTNWTVNTAVPQVTISQAPAALTRQQSTNFVWTVDDASAAVTCQLDSGTPFACSGNKSLSNLADGTHTFTVTAVNNASTSGSASYTWTVDTTPPTIQITGEPGVNLVGAATITWTVDDPAATVTASFDGGTATVEHGTYTVSTGVLSSHQVVLTATDLAGNSSSTTISWTQIL